MVQSSLVPLKGKTLSRSRIRGSKVIIKLNPSQGVPLWEEGKSSGLVLSQPGDGTESRFQPRKHQLNVIQLIGTVMLTVLVQRAKLQPVEATGVQGFSSRLSPLSIQLFSFLISASYPFYCPSFLPPSINASPYFTFTDLHLFFATCRGPVCQISIPTTQKAF